MDRIPLWCVVNVFLVFLCGTDHGDLTGTQLFVASYKHADLADCRHAAGRKVAGTEVGDQRERVDQAGWCVLNHSMEIPSQAKPLTVTSVSSNRSHADAHPLSPESPDVAVSSFTSFRDASIPSNTTTSGSRIVAHEPPASIRQAQKEEGDHTFVPLSRTESNDSADGLFAKELSPRTPDLPRSPFSFHPRETMC